MPGGPIDAMHCLDETELLHETQSVLHRPYLDDSGVGYSPKPDRPELYSLPGWGMVGEVTSVGSADEKPGCHRVSLSD